MRRPSLQRILVLDDYGDAAPESADWAGLPVEFLRAPIPAATRAARLAGADAVVLIRERSAFPAELVARLPALRLVVTAGMRNRVLDLEACSARGIAVCGTDSSAAPTVELCWGLILALARQIPGQEARLRRGQWQHGAGLELAGATLGIAGLGRIGAAVAAIGRAFGMRLLAWSPNMTAETAAAAGAALVSKAKLDNVRLSVSADNVFTVTKFSGIDPDVTETGEVGTKYPFSRKLVFGLQFNF